MPSIHDEDFNLVKQCQSGNKKVFEILVIKYQEKVFRQCYFLLNKSKEDGEEAAQEVFIKAYRNIKNFHGDSKLSSWLYSIAKNHCLNVIKRSNVSPVVVDQDGYKVQSYTTENESLDSNNVDEDCIKKKVSSLATKYRSVIEKVHFDELTYQEAAEKLECPVGTIRSRLARALKKLGPMLKECIQEN